jgi:hypothetical protein
LKERLLVVFLALLSLTACNNNDSATYTVTKEIGRRNIIAYGTTDIDTDLISRSELVIFALYPTIFIEWIEKNQRKGNQDIECLGEFVLG